MILYLLIIESKFYQCSCLIHLKGFFLQNIFKCTDKNTLLSNKYL